MLRECVSEDFARLRCQASIAEGKESGYASAIVGILPMQHPLRYEVEIPRLAAVLDER